MLAVLVYLGALAAPFQFDDWHTVACNPSIRRLDNLRWIFIGSRRFVTNFSYAVDWAIWGARPFGFHLTNILLHALVVLALFVVARTLLGSETGALAAAALFAVHPLLTESVAYVSSRAGLLCTLFLLISVWAWHRALTKRRAWLIVAVAAWVLAAASKETGLLAPLLWVACDWLLVEGARRRLLWYVPLGTLGLLAGGLRIASYLRLENGSAYPFGFQLLTQVEVLWRYCFLWLMPVGLSVVHTVAPVRSALDPLAWLSVASLLTALALLARVRRDSPAATFGGVWYLALLLPTSVMPLMQQMAEHRVYEASVGAALLTGCALEPLARQLGARRAAIAGGIVIVLLGGATIARVQKWCDAVSLWQDAVDKAPNDWSTHYVLGDALRDRGDCARATKEYTAALSLRPGERRARHNRAICQATLGIFDEAKSELQAELDAAPRDATLYHDLGVLESQRGNLTQARQHFIRSAELGSAPACDALGRLWPADPLPPVCSQIR